MNVIKNFSNQEIIQEFCRRMKAKEITKEEV